MRENIYNSKVTFQGKFDYKKFYGDLKKFLKTSGWNGIFGDDNYETLYYHKFNLDNTVLIRFKWEMNKQFWKEEPKITWYVTIDTWISGYNLTTSTGRLDVSISGDHEIEEFNEPKVNSQTEGIFSIFLMDMSKLKGNLEKVRIKGSKVEDQSGMHLYKSCEKIKQWISKYVSLYY